nr:hypothetical protein CFP56_62203 [Quercus suber]
MFACEHGSSVILRAQLGLSPGIQVSYARINRGIAYHKMSSVRSLLHDDGGDLNSIAIVEELIMQCPLNERKLDGRQ